MQFTKEVISMKTFMTIAAVMILTLAFGLAYADEFPIAVKDEAGREVFLGAFPIDTAIPARDFTSNYKSDYQVETGTALYKAHVMKDEMVAGSEVEGSAAGGMAKDDENTRIWDDLLKPTGLSE